MSDAKEVFRKKFKICKRQSDFTVKDMKRPPSAEFLAVVFSDFIGLVILFQKLLKLRKKEISDHIVRSRLWSQGNEV